MGNIGRYANSGEPVRSETHRRHVRYRCAGGHAFAAEIYTAINIQTDKEALDELTFTGLQSERCPECGIDCTAAEPVTLHDPEKMRFALFIPGVLSHEELNLRTVLLTALAAADAADIPLYFGDFQTLVGRAALAAWKTGRQIGLSSSSVSVVTSSTGSKTINGSSTNETSKMPIIHEAFADLADSDHRHPSVLPEPDAEDADDWLDDKALGPASRFPESSTTDRFRMDTKPPVKPSAIAKTSEATFDIEGERIILIHQVPAELDHTFSPKRAELWIQLRVSGGLPLIVLTLVADPAQTDSPHLHWLLDVSRDTHLEIARSLEREFRAEVRIYTRELTEAARFEVGRDRERNVSAVLDRMARVLEENPEPISFDDAATRFRGLAHPLGKEVPPFPDVDPAPARSFQAAQSSIAKLTSWLTPERHDYLVFTRSFSLRRLGEHIRSGLGDAIRFGVRLPDNLKSRAIDVGLAADREDLLLKLTQAFNKLIHRGKGPPEEIAAANWHELFEDCSKEGMELDSRDWNRAEELLDRFGLNRPDGE
ncbi:MAG: hypothetical protein GY854_11565 [Deltaproteobacteria bacterium]|nr:hypothetical protein [Deltaproteobacteria bacterium]